MKPHALMTSLIVALLGLAQPVFAESWFQVEVVVFEYTRPMTDGEAWYGNPGLPRHEHSIGLVEGIRPGQVQENIEETEPDEATTADVRVPYQVLGAERRNLEGVYRVLKLSSDYRPLFHTSWQQPGRSAEQARYVHFSGVRDEDKAVAIADTDDPEGQGDIEAAKPGQIQSHESPEIAFDAMLRLRSSRFLHLDVDAAYFPTDPTVLLAGADARDDLVAYQFADYVRLQESRRIRLKELHYFDHPLFGIIVQVTRIEKEDEEGN